jgi:hypothetical protein
MKLKLIKKSENGDFIRMTDNEALPCSELDWIGWVEGKGSRSRFSKRKLELWKSDVSELYLEGEFMKAKSSNIIYFSFSDKQSIKEYLFVDIDFKKMLCDDDVKEKIKLEIETLIQFDSDLSNKVLACVKSGTDAKNGLHIILKGGFDNDKVKIKTIKNLERYLQSNIQIDLHLNDKDVLDTSSLTNARYMKSIFGIGFSHLNKSAIWTDFDFGKEPQKLSIPDTYEGGFHNKLWAYLCNTSLEEKELYDLYSSELNNKPFSSNKTFGEELSRMFKYTLKLKLIWNKTSKINIFYEDDKGKTKVDMKILGDVINNEFQIKRGGEFFYIKTKDSNVWKIYGYDRLLKRFDFIPLFLETFGVKDMNLKSLASKSINEYFLVSDIDDTNLPKRDKDTIDKIVFNINNGVDFLQINIEKDKVWISNEDFIDGNSIHIPFNNIRLDYDYKNWHMWKSGYFHNITNDYDKLINIIGFSIHMSRDTNNSGRFVVLTDAVNDDYEQSGTGKSVLATVIKYLRVSSFIEMKGNEKGSFFLQKLTHASQVIHIDEFPKDGDIQIFRNFYSNEPLSIEKKFKDIFDIDPIKVIICSNYMLNDTKADADRRIEVGFKRYYERRINPLDKTLGYKAFVDKRLLSGIDFTTTNGELINSNDWWMGYLSFMIHCAKSYLNNVDYFIEDIVKPEDKLIKQHTAYQNTHTKLYDEVIENIKSIIKDNKETYEIRNKDVCDVYNSSGRTLGIVKYMIKTYCELFTNYTYDRQLRKDVVYHVIQKKKLI